MKGADLHHKDHSIQLFTDASNEGWGTHLEHTSTKGLWSDREKRLHINVLELKAVSLALQSFKDQCQNQRVLVTTQLNSSGLHKQIRRNSLSRDMHSPVEDHDLVPSLPDNLKSQTHPRVSECDGRPSVQAEPSAVNRMVTASTGVQTDLSKVVHPSCGSICHSSEPQTSTVHVSSPRPQCLGHRWSKHKMVGSHCLCLPSDGSPSQGDPDHCNSPRLARNALVLGPSAALNRDPTSATSVNNPSQTVPRLCVSQQSTTSLPKWNLSVVLNELTKAPFEPMKDTDLKHLTLKTAFLLALASGKRCSKIHAWVANKVSNLGQWERLSCSHLIS